MYDPNEPNYVNTGMALGLCDAARAARNQQIYEDALHSRLASEARREASFLDAQAKKVREATIKTEGMERGATAQYLALVTALRELAPEHRLLADTQHPWPEGTSKVGKPMREIDIVGWNAALARAKERDIKKPARFF